MKRLFDKDTWQEIFGSIKKIRALIKSFTYLSFYKKIDLKSLLTKE